MIDLHMHSTCSDGTLTPEELVAAALDLGLEAAALTDHDTIDGIDEALAYASSMKSGAVPFPQTAASAEGSDSPVVPEVIPGIEFSTEWGGRDVHVVALSIDHKKPSFLSKLKDFIDLKASLEEKLDPPNHTTCF